MYCETCNREKELEFHHLIPRSNHSNKWFKKNFTSEDMKKRGMMVCYDCHLSIHKRYTSKVLGKHFNTKESLLMDEKLAKIFKFFSKQK